MAQEDGYTAPRAEGDASVATASECRASSHAAIRGKGVMMGSVWSRWLIAALGRLRIDRRDL